MCDALRAQIRSEEDKFKRLLQILGVWYEKGQILVFVDTQQHCDSLFADLLRIGYPALSLHGGKDQFDRDQVRNLAPRRAADGDA
jgi:ATP-dependent RNA helicase DDX46/PRP5